MCEDSVVEAISISLRNEGYQVAKEVANFYRSADIAAIDIDGNVIVIECKISNIGKALEQLEIHKLSADKVYIGTVYRKTRKDTKRKLEKAGVGLIYVKKDGQIEIANESAKCKFWVPAKNKLKNRILECL